jgi:hypothetical protein
MAMKLTLSTGLVLAILSAEQFVLAESPAAVTGLGSDSAPPSSGDVAPAPPADSSEGSSPSAVGAPVAPVGPALVVSAPNAPVATSDDSESEISISVPRPDDMQKMTEASLKEVQLGTARGRYSLNFFGDTAFTVSSSNHAKAHPSFGIGSLDTLLTAELENSIRLTAEFALEIGDDNSAGIDLERLHLRWSKWGMFVEAGRWHTDLGYWNDAYHHGTWLQPTHLRPRLVRFEDEGGILPVHWVGVQAGYAAKLGGTAELRTSFAVGNSRGAIVDNVQSGHDEHNPKALHAKIELSGVGVRDLHVGFSGVYGRIAAQPATVRPALPNASINELIGNAYIAYAGYPFQLISEGYVISHRAKALMSTKTIGAFLVMGYSFAPLTPYIRLERIHHSGDPDAFFVPNPAAQAVDLDVGEGLVGLRVDTSTWSAIKAEYWFTRDFDRRIDTHTALLAWACGI